MNDREYFNLQPGDTIRNIGSGNAYVILEVRRAGIAYVVVAVMTVIVSNPSEWEVVRRSVAVQEDERE